MSSTRRGQKTCDSLDTGRTCVPERNGAHRLCKGDFATVSRPMRHFPDLERAIVGPFSGSSPRPACQTDAMAFPREESIIALHAARARGWINVRVRVIHRGIELPSATGFPQRRSNRATWWTETVTLAINGGPVECGSTTYPYG